MAFVSATREIIRGEIIGITPACSFLFLALKNSLYYAMENKNMTAEGTMPVLAFIPCARVAMIPEYQFRDYLPGGIFFS